MFAFPRFDTLDGQQEIRRLLHIGCDINYTGGADELARRDGIGGVVWQVFTGDPVDRRVEMRTCVLAQVHDVPVPGWPATIIARNFAGKSMTTVSGPSGVVRSTTFRLPELSSSSSCDKTLLPMISPSFSWRPYGPGDGPGGGKPCQDILARFDCDKYTR